jgi:hypothetical protein
MNKEAESLYNKTDFNKYIIPGGFTFRVFILLFLTYSISFSQVKTNLQVFYNLADSASKQLISSLPAGNNKVDLKINAGSEYSVLNNKIIEPFYQNGIKTDSNGLRINFVIDNAFVVYNEMFRDGLLGNYQVGRTITLQGNYSIQNKGVSNFTLTSNDTIPLEEINNAESVSFSFTHAEVPQEPFFQGLFEPVVAISAAAAAIILFFTVRSH